MNEITQQPRRRVKLPHIPRLFTATILPGMANIALWVFIISLISLNSLLLKTKPLAYADKLLIVFSQPLSALAHKNLALSMWASGSRVSAKQELLIADELTLGQHGTTSNQVLGASTTPDPADLLQTWENAPVQEAAEITYWQNIAAAHPDYRDADIQLAALSYAQGNLIQTKTYLTRASQLDPNGTAVRDLLKFITKEVSR